jgi:4-hydroxybenzoate polyprenyltransferase
MGKGAARDLTVRRSRRSRLHAYLLLARFSNLPTIWTNVLAGTIVSGAAFVRADVGRLCLAMSALYTAGMFLNDAFDRDFDARVRPDRPIPAGDVSARETFATGWILLAVGLLLAAVAGRPASLAWGTLLAATIVLYNYRHKANPFGPVLMGACRGLVYCVAAAAAAEVTPAVAVAASALAVYVGGLTWIAKLVGSRAGWSIPILIAGISIVDAGVIAWSGGGPLVWVALAGFPATLLLQRVVPGT